MKSEQQHLPTLTNTTPYESQGRPNEKHGLEAHRTKRPTRLRSPNKAPVPDHPKLRRGPDGASHPQFHASKSRALVTTNDGEVRLAAALAEASHKDFGL